MDWNMKECQVGMIANQILRYTVTFTGIVESLKIITREKSWRIAKYAFDYATRHERKRVTAIHKANIMSVLHVTTVWMTVLCWLQEVV